MTGTRCSARLRDLMQYTISKHAECVAFLDKRKGDYTAVSYAELGRDLEALGIALREVLPMRARVVLLGKNSYAYALTLLALLQGAFLPVPADTALSRKELEAMVKDTDATAIFYDESQAEKALSLTGVRAIPFADRARLVQRGRAQGERGAEHLFEVLEDGASPAMLCYRKEGSVLLSHQNILAALGALEQAFGVTPADTYLSVCPLASMQELVAGLLHPLSCGASVAFGEGVSTLLGDMQRVRPTTMVVPPFLAERIYRRLLEAAKEQGWEKVRRTMGVTDAIRPFSLRQKMKAKLLCKVRRPFGGALCRMVIVGGMLAPFAEQGLSQMGVFPIPTWGTAECVGFVSVGRERGGPEGSVGALVAGGEMAVENADAFGNGMLFYRGENLAMANEGEWYATGEMGRVDEEGHLFVLGRCENVLSQENNVYVCPEELERLLCESPLVADAVAVGVPAEGGGVEIAAVLSPEREYIEKTYGKDLTKEALEGLVADVVSEVNEALPPQKRMALFTLREEPFPRQLPEAKLRALLASELLNSVE